MASSTDLGATTTSLSVIIPVPGKRSRLSVETQVADALKAGCAISKMSIVAISDQRDQKRSLKNCSFLATWLAEHASQLDELILSLTEADEVKLVSSLFTCSNLKLTKLLLSCADVSPALLAKLPDTLEVFSGHLGSHADLELFANLPRIQSLAVRCYSRVRHSDTTATIPLSLLHHPALRCLVIDVNNGVVVDSSTKLPPDAPKSQLKLLAVTGDLATPAIVDMLRAATQLEHLCLRASHKSQMWAHMSGLKNEPSKAFDVGHLKNMKAMELGFPVFQVSGLEKLHNLQALLLCGLPSKTVPPLPKALAEVADEDDEIPDQLKGKTIMRRAVAGGNGDKYRINEALSLQHHLLVLDPTIFDDLSKSIAALG